ncbi:protein FAM240A isoform X4 [Takifugu rubripes]|uniref:protein FAM240A isoform X4 n=1 Tax=Takifugu rubripes TaxID=31033 RepID=UPI001145F234|nr:protein FAM240A isoform X4 [Takifugu rubripes]XP_029685447.1 protein FAM240A isoform X4 [Takifugu rubripes]XP_029685448.1 protein FAM240A isoform X4 [Takifugu rubripes]
MYGEHEENMRRTWLVDTHLCVKVCCFEMNLALVHNRQHIQTLWEKRISSRCQYEENEEQRMEKSALKRLRGEWLTRLETRNKHLKSVNTNMVKTNCSADPS